MIVVCGGNASAGHGSARLLAGLPPEQDHGLNYFINVIAIDFFFSFNSDSCTSATEEILS